MNVFPLTLWHLVILRSLCSALSNKMVQILIPVTITPLVSLFPCLRLSEPKIHLTVLSICKMRFSEQPHTYNIMYKHSGQQSQVPQHFGPTVMAPVSHLQKQNIWFYFFPQSDTSSNCTCWANSFRFFARRLCSVPKSIRGVLRLSIQTWNYWTAGSVNPTACPAEQFSFHMHDHTPSSLYKEKHRHFESKFKKWSFQWSPNSGWKVACQCDMAFHLSLVAIFPCSCTKALCNRISTLHNMYEHEMVFPADSNPYMHQQRFNNNFIMVLELKALESNCNDDYLQNTGKHAPPFYVSLPLLVQKRGTLWCQPHFDSVIMVDKLLFVNYMKSFKIRRCCDYTC